MGNYKIISFDKLILQGMMIEQKIASMPTEVNTESFPTVYSIGLYEDLFFSTAKEIVSYYFDEMEVIPPISKFEFLGEMDYMKNVVKEETTDGIITYYSYLDKDNFYTFSLDDALNSKIAQWKHINGDITRLYVELQKRGADIDFGTTSLKLVNKLNNN